MSISTSVPDFFIPMVGGGVMSPTVVNFTRPNNVIAYAAGQVYGPAGDARFSVTSPPLSGGEYRGGYGQLYLKVVNTRPSTDAQINVTCLLSSAQFTTVLGDQQPLALTDAEIADIVPRMLGNVNLTMGTGVGTFTLNLSAGLAGRRGGSMSFVLDNSGVVFPPSTTLYGYLWSAAAYNPLALEEIRITPLWGYYAALA